MLYNHFMVSIYFTIKTANIFCKAFLYTQYFFSIYSKSEVLNGGFNADFINCV